MRQIWDLLLANPIIFFVLAAWAAGAIGNALRTKSAQRKAAEQRTQRQLQPRPANQPPAQSARPEPARQARVEPPPLVRKAQTGGGSRSPDEIAAEMRRILGLDVEITPAVRERSEPVRREPRRETVQPERPPTVVAPTTQSRHLELHERSHVGEQLAARKGPHSGIVGAHDSTFGSLGGRNVRRAPRVRVSTVQRLIDLSDLKRTILAYEILGPPVCLRGDNEMRAL